MRSIYYPLAAHVAIWFTRDCVRRRVWLYRCIKLAIVHDVAEGALSDSVVVAVGPICWSYWLVSASIVFVCITSHLLRIPVAQYCQSYLALPIRGMVYSADVNVVCAAIVGDITPHDGVSDKEKYRLENGAIEKIRQTIGSDLLAGARFGSGHCLRV